MTGNHQFRNRRIQITTTCADNAARTHWHASRIERLSYGDSSQGMGWCLTTPAALLWLLTGFSRKAWAS